MTPRQAEIVETYRSLGSVRKVAELLGISPGTVGHHLEKAGEPVREAGNNYGVSLPGQRFNNLTHEIEDGVVLVGSDAHKWPESHTTAMRALIYFAAELQPNAIVLNGDGLDGARISRHSKGSWETGRPTVAQELDALVGLMDDIQAVAPDTTRFMRTRGNHDDRFDKWLANRVPEMEGVSGMCLDDHLDWEVSWGIWINPGAGRSPVHIKHRFKGGTHATHNNTLYAGVSIVTGHDHMLKVTPFSDYWGTRWGISTGTLAVPYTQQFEYGEGNPENHQSGFQVLTFKDGKLLWPEPVYVTDEEAGLVHFRGELIHV